MTTDNQTTSTPDTIEHVTVLGTGVLGSQIAYQASYAGFSVTAWDIDDDALAAARNRFELLVTTYLHDVTGAGENNRAAKAAASITTTSDLAKAVADADLVIEAVPENIDIKRDTWRKVGAVAPERTIFATNSSTLLPSAISGSSGRPAKFLALHFANHIWAQNTAEIMGSSETSPEVVDTVVAYAEKMGMVPIVLKKEKAGYVLNSLLVPLLEAASELLVDGYADIDTVDKTWRIGTGAPLGPFQIFDIVGLQTAYNISAASDDPVQQRFAAYVKKHYLDEGKLGTSSGEGFYSYH